MKVHFYGKLGALLGAQLEVDTEQGSTVAAVRQQLRATYPHAREALDDGRVKAVVGDAVVRDDYVLADNDELEFLAPVSGG